MRKIKFKILKWLLKSDDIQNYFDSEIKHENIAYHNWVLSCNKYGFPKNENGTPMNSWQLHDYYIKNSGKRFSLKSHAKKYDTK